MTICSFAQNKKQVAEGKVSYITSNNVYVKFQNTSEIEIGDTLKITEGNIEKPCLIVNNKSSTSCVCVRISDCSIVVENFVTHVSGHSSITNIEGAIENELDETTKSESDIELDITSIEQDSTIIEPFYKERIRARVSAASYSNFSSLRENRHRMMYRFSLNAHHINNSKYSMESYVNYRQNYIGNSNNPEKQTKFFRIYNLALRYEIDTTTSLTFGRKINNKTSSLGAIDGLQAEKNFGTNYIGVIFGFRPDITDFGFNPNLFEFGGYFGKNIRKKNLFAQSTFGLLEQRNGTNIDRRYAYFQHSSTIMRKLSVFSSFEIDLYNKINGESNNTARLTNLYLSFRYRLSRRINFGIAYDSRKRIIYYESLKTEIERLLEDDDARQGLRFTLSIRPMKFVSLGVNYSKRFQQGSANKSNNINSYISFSNLPIGGRISINYNRNTTNYLESNILSFRHSRTLINRKLNGDFYFRIVDYNYFNNEVKLKQKYYGTSLSYNIDKKLSFSILAEWAIRNTENNKRINAKILKRFGS